MGQRCPHHKRHGRVTVPATDQPGKGAPATLAGIHSALEQQGAALVGGHTLEARHSPPLPHSLGVQVSLSVNGTSEDLSKQGIQAGDILLLSRPRYRRAVRSGHERSR